jgi:hypothetical protein
VSVPGQTALDLGSEAVYELDVYVATGNLNANCGQLQWVMRFLSEELKWR